MRSGKVNKYISNTNVFEHSGKFYSVAESHMPQEIDIFSLKTLNNWELSAVWNRPFTSHPKVFWFTCYICFANQHFLLSTIVCSLSN